MKFPVWYEKSKGGYFYKPVHWAGWLIYLVSFADIFAAFHFLSEKGMTPTDQLKAVLPVVIINFIVLAVIVFLTTAKKKV